MIKRLFVNDRLFSVLLMILFVSVFLIMFYGLDLYYQFSKIQENVDNIKYKEEYDYGIRFEGDMLLKNGKFDETTTAFYAAQIANMISFLHALYFHCFHFAYFQTLPLFLHNTAYNC